jgi:ATP-dependent DNA helicase DinG
MTDIEFFKVFPYKTARPFQKPIVDQIVEAFDKGKKYVLLNAPTGIGKSAIAYTVAAYYNHSYILTCQKILQQQYVNDFSSQFFGIGNIKGRSNYTCKRNPHLNCHMGACTIKKGNKPCQRCAYKIARDQAFANGITLTNYSYFFSMLDASVNDDELIKKRDFLVLDECHNIESELIDYVGVSLDNKVFEEKHIDLEIPIPDANLKDQEKIDFLFNVIKPELEKKLEEEKRHLESLPEDDDEYISQVKKCSFLDKINCSVNILYNNINYINNFHIVIIQNDVMINYKPLYCKTFTQKYLFDKADHILMMSATIVSKEQHCKDLGLKLEDVVYIQCPSVFPKENRPIHNLAIGSMNYAEKNATKPYLVKAIDELLKAHKNERGIIHTVSYDIAQYIIDNIDSNRFVIPRGKERDKVIEHFLTSDRKDLVLISPSLSEGIDLKGDLSRFSIICKVPYGNLGDKWIKTRMEVDKNWYIENTVKTIIQMCGRSIRTETDFANTYILDSAFDYFFSINKKKFPEWWKESLQ